MDRGEFVSCMARVGGAPGTQEEEIKILTHDNDQREKIAALEAQLAALKSDAATVAHLRSVRERVAEGRGAGAHLSDAEVAGRMRMLAPSDLDHEMVCVMARDRIIGLSDELAALTRQIGEAGTPKHEVSTTGDIAGAGNADLPPDRCGGDGTDLTVSDAPPPEPCATCGGTETILTVSERDGSLTKSPCPACRRTL